MTNRELVDAAWAETMQSTISGVEWLNRKTNGYKGKPYNWQATAFGRAKALLDQVLDLPVPPPPTPGVTREAFPGQALSVIAASSPGDTVLCRGGQHPKLVLQTSFPDPRVTIRCEAGTFFAAVDTNGLSGYRFSGIDSRLPVEFNDYTKTPFLLRGPSARITLTGGSKISGGYDCIKSYGPLAMPTDCVLDGFEAWGGGGDVIHIDGARNMRIDNCVLRDPDGSGPEHEDGIHGQCFDGLYLGPGVKFTWPITPRSDNNYGIGVFFNKAPDTAICRGLVIDGSLFEKWWAGRAVMIVGVDGTTELRAPRVVDCGNGTTSPDFTLGSKTTDQKFECWGVDQSKVWFNNALARAQTVFH